eukprot:jgi/Botrbrau1/7098/Bobra.0165s0120.2
MLNMQLMADCVRVMRTDSSQCCGPSKEPSYSYSSTRGNLVRFRNHAILASSHVRYGYGREWRSELDQPELSRRGLMKCCQRFSRHSRERILKCHAMRDTDIADVAAAKFGGLESTKIPSKVREKVEAALDRLGPSVTVGDVSAAAGVTISQAETALNALACDTQGTLEVSSTGDVIYSLPRDFRSILRNKSLLLRLAPAFKTAQNIAGYITRVSFGTALVASVAVVWAAVFALLTTQQSDRDDRRGGQVVYYQRSPFSTIINLTDLFWYWDPYYYQRQRVRMASGEKMNFFEAIFSFVFGDGDPNEDFEEMRWRLVGQYIKYKGGVVTAEELAPFLDVPADNLSRNDIMVDEGFVVPALVRFGGSPEVNASGNLVYRFPSLQKTRQQRKGPGPPEQGAALEKTWDLTKAGSGQKVGAIALGIANLLGVTVLTSLLINPVNQYRLAMSSLGFVSGALPLLQVWFLP